MNLANSVFSLSHEVAFLGTLVDTLAGVLRHTPNKIQISLIAQRLLTSSCILAGHLQRVLGLMVASQVTVPLVWFSPGLNFRRGRDSLQQEFPLVALGVLEALIFWWDLQVVDQGAPPRFVACSQIMNTDSSSTW